MQHAYIILIYENLIIMILTAYLVCVLQREQMQMQHGLMADTRACLSRRVKVVTNGGQM